MAHKPLQVGHHYKFNSNYALLDFFPSIVLFLRTPLVPHEEGLLKRNWPPKSVDHGVQRLLPLAPPMGWRRPNPAYRHHPHTMGKRCYAWFGRRLCQGQVMRYNILHIKKVLDFLNPTGREFFFSLERT